MSRRVLTLITAQRNSTKHPQFCTTYLDFYPIGLLRISTRFAYSTYSQTLVQGQQSLNVTSGESGAYKIGFINLLLQRAIFTTTGRSLSSHPAKRLKCFMLGRDYWRRFVQNLYRSGFGLYQSCSNRWWRRRTGVIAYTKTVPLDKLTEWKLRNFTGENSWNLKLWPVCSLKWNFELFCKINIAFFKI